MSIECTRNANARCTDCESRNQRFRTIYYTGGIKVSSWRSGNAESLGTTGIVGCQNSSLTRSMFERASFARCLPPSSQIPFSDSILETRKKDSLSRVEWGIIWHDYYFFSFLFFFSSSNKRAREESVPIEEKLNGPTWSTFLPRGIAKAGEPNNFLPMSPASLHMDPTVYATLRRKQRRLARENPGVLMAVARGANQAIAECQHQFRNRRWNCSTKNFLRGKNLFGKIVDRGEHRISFLFLRCFFFFFFIPRPIIWFVNCRSKIISAARASLIDVQRYIYIYIYLRC